MEKVEMRMVALQFSSYSFYSLSISAYLYDIYDEDDNNIIYLVFLIKTI